MSRIQTEPSKPPPRDWEFLDYVSSPSNLIYFFRGLRVNTRQPIIANLRAEKNDGHQSQAKSSPNRRRGRRGGISSFSIHAKDTKSLSRGETSPNTRS